MGESPAKPTVDGKETSSEMVRSSEARIRLSQPTQYEPSEPLPPLKPPPPPKSLPLPGLLALKVEVLFES